MAVILTESVAITKSRLTKGFNGDNLNLNGRTISAEDADKGFKAAGAVKPPYISVMASGNQKGFAAGAAAAFNDYIKEINLNKYNARSIFEKYFSDMDAVIEKCSIEDSRLSLGIVCTYNDCVIAAKTGNCHILRYSDGELFEIALSDSEEAFGFQFIDGLADGDMFALIGEECSRDLDYDKIVTTFDSGTDLKIMIRDFFNIIASKSRGLDCSVILMRLKCDCERTFANIPEHADNAPRVEGDEAAVYDSVPDNFAVQPPIDADELSEQEDVVSDNEAPKNGKSPSAGKKIASFIPIAILVIILAAAAALYIATRKPLDPVESESTSDGPVQQISLKEEDTSEGEFNGSNGMQTVEDTEYNGNPLNENENNQTPDTPAAETTTRRTQQATTPTNSQQPNTPEPNEPDEPEVPNDTPADDPNDEPDEPPVVDTPDTPNDTPNDTPDTPNDEPIDTPNDEPIDTPVDEPIDTPVDEPADNND